MTNILSNIFNKMNYSSCVFYLNVQTEVHEVDITSINYFKEA